MLDGDTPSASTSTSPPRVRPRSSHLQPIYSGSYQVRRPSPSSSSSSASLPDVASSPSSMRDACSSRSARLRLRPLRPGRLIRPDHHRRQKRPPAATSSHTSSSPHARVQAAPRRARPDLHRPGVRPRLKLCPTFIGRLRPSRQDHRSFSILHLPVTSNLLSSFAVVLRSIAPMFTGRSPPQDDVVGMLQSSFDQVSAPPSGSSSEGATFPSTRVSPSQTSSIQEAARDASHGRHLHARVCTGPRIWPLDPVSLASAPSSSASPRSYARPFCTSSWLRIHTQYEHIGNVLLVLRRPIVLAGRPPDPGLHLGPVQQLSRLLLIKFVQ
nr:uncharacterized protein LOC127298543 [Lolium perenne]XP_051184353.1 uncharacterized protein LOC127298543 [Lolium perenne]XP_051184355.1 uncharacterized protein LOC127298543 [Lolium perenne]